MAYTFDTLRTELAEHAAAVELVIELCERLAHNMSVDLLESDRAALLAAEYALRHFVTPATTVIAHKAGYTPPEPGSSA